MKCCVIIPMYGQEEYTRKCIELVKKNSGIQTDILVVDDGSIIPFKHKYEEKIYIDGRVMEILDYVNVLRLEKNSGFTAATNAGIIYAQKLNYDYVLLLNNDTEPEPNFIKHLIDTMESDSTIGIACSVRRHLNRSHDPMELCGSDLIRGFQYFVSEDKLPKTPIDCNSIALCSGLLRMSMVREIGILDKRMRNHCSDSDYCIRAKINGWKIMLVPNSIVVHHLSITTKANNVIVDDDQKIMLRKLAGLDYGQLMASMPLDGEAKTYGRLEFSVYTK